jgi:hypothetical protein
LAGIRPGDDIGCNDEARAHLSPGRRPRRETMFTRMQDALITTGAAAYFIGFVVAVEVALSRLVY